MKSSSKMKSSIPENGFLVAAVFIALSSFASAKNVVSVSFEKVSWPNPNMSKRDGLSPRGIITELLYNNITAYMANITIGTPGQAVSLSLDTGSSDLWIYSHDADLCTSAALQAENGYGCGGGTFDKSKSSTYKTLIKNGFKIQYVDMREASGDYIADDVGIAGSTIKSLQMGLASSATVPNGILGIGYSVAGAQAADVPYPNIIDQMVSQGLINTKAYSLYLDDLNAQTGSILFGGIDTSKFVGQLTTLKLAKSAHSGLVSTFAVPLTGVSIGNNGDSISLTSSNFTEVVILDTGTTLTYLPSSVVENLATQLGAILDQSLSAGTSMYVSCTILTANPNGTLQFQFGSSSGPVISVPLSEIVMDIIPDAYQSEFRSATGWTRTCFVGISTSVDTQSVSLLGDTFLRSAYVVYDLTNNQVGIAQTNFEASDSNIIEIQKGDTQIPDATGVASQAAVTQTASVFGLGGGEGFGSTKVPSGTPVGTDGSGNLAQATVTVTAGASSKAAAGRVAVPSFERGGWLSGVVGCGFAVVGAAWFMGL